MPLTRQARQEWANGWTLPIASGLGYAISSTQLYTFSVFIEPIQADLGWSRAQTLSGFGMLSVILLFAPVSGILVDRYGPRKVGLTGVTFYCAALAALSLATQSLWVWWLLWVFIGLGGLMIQPTTWVTAIASRFDHARGLALSITLCGSALASAFFPLLSNVLLGQFGWRGAYVAMGLILASAALPMMFAYFRDAHDVRKEQSPIKRQPIGGREAWAVLKAETRSSQFWKLAGISLFALVGVSAMLVHFIPILVEKGISRDDAVVLAGVMGGGSLIGRLATGVLLDRFGGLGVGAISFSLPIIVLLTLTLAPSNLAVATFAAILFGVTLGSEIDVLSYLASRYFKMNNLGILYGVMVSLQGFAMGASPVAAGLIYDAAGSYPPILFGLIPVFAFAAILTATLGPPRQAAATLQR